MPTAPQAPPAVPNLPATPNIAAPDTFDGLMQAWIDGQPAYRTGMVSLAQNAFSNATSANESATGAASSATGAASSATGAAASANAAAGSANAALWVVNTNYAQGANAISRIDWLTYRSNAAGVSATDPKNDPGRWVMVSNTVAVTAMVLQEIQATGVAAGNGTGSAVTYIRPLNTVLTNSIAGATLTAGGVINLPAGTYDIYASSTQYAANFGRLMLFDHTGNAGILWGQNGYGAGAVVLAGQFTLAAGKAVSLRHHIIAQNTNYTNMLGSPFASGSEIYSVLQLWKVR